MCKKQKYRVWVRCISYRYLDIESNSMNEAYEEAENMDEGGFILDDEMSIYDITKIETGEKAFYCM